MSFFPQHTLTGMDTETGHTLATGGKTDEIFCQLSKAFFPSTSLDWPRQTEHVTTPALPSASSFSCHCSLIAEVIRLGKAVLKIKVSHVSQHFCLGGYMWCLKETSIEATKAPLHPLLLLDLLLSFCCRENDTREELHFTENVLVVFIRESRGQS